MQFPYESLESFMILQNEEEIRKASELARELHKDQKRKSTNVPYFEHLISVANMVKSCGGSNNQVIAAFLHDAIEDQGDKITIEKIEKQFGKEVADIVYDCSELQEIEDYKERKIFHLAKINDRKLRSTSSPLVMLCDKVHNAKEILANWTDQGDAIWDNFTRGKETLIWFYSEMESSLGAYTQDNTSLVPLHNKLKRIMNLIQKM